MEHQKAVFSGSLLVLLRGILSKSWHIRWCILYPGTEHRPPRIEIFESELHSTKHPKDKKVIDLKNVHKIDIEKLLNKPKGFEHGFEIVTKQQKHSFGVDTELGLNSWVKVLHQHTDNYVNSMAGAQTGHATVARKASDSDEEGDFKHLYMDDNVIYESADSNAVPMFRVKIQNNVTAERFGLHGWYYLAINPINLALVDCGSRMALYQWPYRFIRRFGRTDEIFQFESGRRCLSGAGNFVFTTSEGDAIHKNVNLRTKQIIHQEEAVGPSVRVSDKTQKSLEKTSNAKPPEKHPDPKENDKIIQGHEPQEQISSVVSKKPVPKARVQCLPTEPAPRNVLPPEPVPRSNSPADPVPKSALPVEPVPRSNSVGQSYISEHNSMKEASNSKSERASFNNTIGPSHISDNFKKELDIKLRHQEKAEENITLSKSEKNDSFMESKDESSTHALAQRSLSVGSDKKNSISKKEEKKRKEEEEKERKKKLKEEQKREKEEKKRLKEEEKRKKSEKKKQKNAAHPPVELNVYDEAMVQYEDIRDIQAVNTVEPMYAEAMNNEAPPIPEYKPGKSDEDTANPTHNPSTAIYSMPEKKTGDAWKQYCREGDEHSEDYDKIKLAAAAAAAVHSKAEFPPRTAEQDGDEDCTYDHFDTDTFSSFNVKKPGKSENIYGISSAISIGQKHSAVAENDVPTYEEADGDLVSARLKMDAESEPLYEEADVQVMSVGRDCDDSNHTEDDTYDEASPPPLRPSLEREPPQGNEEDDEEDTYSNIT